MIASGLVLFLFGTAVSAGPFIAPTPTEIIISKNRHSSADNVVEYYPSHGKAPFISNFIQSGTNVFFKPQFMLSAEQMPPQIQQMIAAIEKDDCKTTYPVGPVPVVPIIEEPLRIIEKEFVASPEVKEIIEINPMAIRQPVTMPKLPLVVEEPCVVPAYVPKVEIPAPMVPVIVEVEGSRPPLVIPPAPVLPPLEMPKIPLMIEEIAAVPEVPVVVEVEQAKEIVMPVIPPAPVLPPMELPKMPVIIEEPCAPVEVVQEVQPVVIPAAPMLPTFIPEPFVHEVVVEEKPIVIPEAPVLPPYMPPMFPTVLIEEKAMAQPILPAVPCETVEVIEPVHPVVVPEAPVLPPLEMPQLTVLAEGPSVIPCDEPLVLPTAPVLPTYVPEVIIPQPAPVMIEEKPLVIPQAPVLPPFTMPKLPEVIVKENVIMNPLPPVPCDTIEIIGQVQPMVIPEAPLLPPMKPLEIPAPVVVEVEKKVVEHAVLPLAPVLPSIPCDTVEIIQEHVKPMMIPEAPLLAPLAIPAPIIVEEPASVEIKKEILKPVAIPAAPVLAPLNIPRAPLMVERPAEVLVAPCPPESEIIVEQKPLMSMPFAYSELSAAPMAPEFFIPYTQHNKGSVIVEKNSLPSLPAPWAQGVVVEHMTPTMEMALRPKVAKAPVPMHLAPLGYAML